MRPKELSAQIRLMITAFATSHLLLGSNELTTQQLKRNQLRITWSGAENCTDLFNEPSQSFGLFKKWLKAGAYTMLLWDGSLIQMTYDFRRGKLCGHRIAYIPCPLDIDSDLLESEVLDELIDCLGSTADDIQLRSMVRFDYDPANQKEKHPATHLTINNSECRIPVKSPLYPGTFVDFIIRNFYPDKISQHEFLKELPRNKYDGITIADKEQEILHLTEQIAIRN